MIEEMLNDGNPCHGPVRHPRQIKDNETEYWYCGMTDTYTVGPCEHLRKTTLWGIRLKTGFPTQRFGKKT